MKLLHFLGWTLAGVPWALALLLGYWALEPVPLRVTYVAPLFSSQPVDSRASADAYAISEVVGGSTVWRYVEYCVDRPFTGEIRRSWVNPAMVWAAPDLPTALSRTQGCSRRSIAVEVPTSNPTRMFEFVQRLRIQVNPVRTVEIDYPPITLRILANK